MIGELQDTLPEVAAKQGTARVERWAADAELLRQNPGMWGLIETRKSSISRSKIVETLAGELGDWRNFDGKVILACEDGEVVRQVWARFIERDSK